MSETAKEWGRQGWSGRTVMAVDLDKLASNLDNIRGRLRPGVRTIAVMKGNGYGHGAIPLYHALRELGVDYYAVSIWEEGAALRKAGATEPILVMGDTPADQAAQAVAEDLDLTVYSADGAERLSQAAVRAGVTQKIQIKLDTGLHRIGFLPGEEMVRQIRSISELPGLRITGVFSHFACADDADPANALEQYACFTHWVERLRAAGIQVPFVHMANSPAILLLPRVQLDAVRAGDILYGLCPTEALDWSSTGLQEIASWYSYVAMVKDLPAGAAIGYEGTRVTTRPTRLATIPVGFADGYNRNLSNRGWVMIHGQKAPIMGLVCMDQMMVDVTDIPDVAYGDQVTLLGEGMTIREMAAMLKVNVDEIVCNISARVPRIYVKRG